MFGLVGGFGLAGVGRGVLACWWLEVTELLLVAGFLVMSGIEGGGCFGLDLTGGCLELLDSFPADDMALSLSLSLVNVPCS